jgi:hypothetical protein
MGAAMGAAMTAAERQREHRRRRKAKALRTSIDVPPALVEHLIDCSYLPAWDALDANLDRRARRELARKVAKALEAFHRDAIKDVTL